MADLAQIKIDTVLNLKNDLFFEYFSQYPDSVLEEAFDNAVAEVRYGLRDCLQNLDPYEDTVYLYSCLTAHYLLGFSLTEDPPGTWKLTPGREIPALFRTVGTKSADGLSISYESERLGIGLNNPFEQWLSTTSYGFRCIQMAKDCAFRKGRVFIV